MARCLAFWGHELPGICNSRPRTIRDAGVGRLAAAGHPGDNTGVLSDCERVRLTRAGNRSSVVDCLDAEPLEFLKTVAHALEHLGGM